MAPIPQVPDYGAWMKSYGPILRRYYLRRVPADDVDDLVQDVFLRIQTAQSESPVENVESYLFTTAYHVLVSHHRKQATKLVSLQDDWTASAEVIDLISPERIAIAFEEYERLITAICNLPPRARQAFELSRFEELTYQSIAERMGIKKDSVKELIHRALSQIAKELEAGR